MTSNTPRMAYRMGKRAWLDVLADKNFPSTQIADAKDEVAAVFKGIPKILIGNRHAGGEKQAALALPKYRVNVPSGAGLGSKNDVRGQKGLEA
jgi:hypothetical protein